MSIVTSIENKAAFYAAKVVRHNVIKQSQRSISYRCQAFIKNNQYAVIGNAIPKSGTYLLNSILRAIGHWGDPCVHVLDNTTFLMKENSDSIVLNIPVKDSLRALPSGVMTAAHFHYSAEVAKCFSKLKIKHIFQYRDFRDVFLSYALFYAKNDKAAHWARPRAEQAFFQEFFSDQSDRVTYSICKMMENCNFEGYAGWLHDSDTLALKFEDVYEELLSAESDMLGPTLQKLLRFLEVDADSIGVEKFKQKVLGGSRTKSDIKAKSRRYQYEFTEDHYRLIDNVQFRNLMQMFNLEL